MSIRFFLLLTIFFFNSKVYSKVMEHKMNDNSILLLSEITRVGESEKWNSSQFFEGSLQVNVLKDGTVTDTGAYILSKNKFGYPAELKVINLNNKQKKYKFIFSPASQPLFKKSISVDVELLNKNNFYLKKMEQVDKKSSLYISPYSPSILYKYTFINQKSESVVYDFYSPQSEIKKNLEYVRLVVSF